MGKGGREEERAGREKVGDRKGEKEWRGKEEGTEKGKEGEKWRGGRWKKRKRRKEIEKA